MYARIGTIDGDKEKIDQALDIIKGSLRRDIKGMKGSYLMADRKTGRIIAMTLWDSAEDRDATSNMAEETFKKVADVTRSKPKVENFDIVRP